MNNEKTFVAKVVQYFQPNGRTEVIDTDLPMEYKELYDSMTKDNFIFSAEVLQNGIVSVTIQNSDMYDIDVEVSHNNQKVQEKLCDMLTRKSWKDETILQEMRDNS